MYYKQFEWFFSNGGRAEGTFSESIDALLQRTLNYIGDYSLDEIDEICKLIKERVELYIVEKSYPQDILSNVQNSLTFTENLMIRGRLFSDAIIKGRFKNKMDLKITDIQAVYGLMTLIDGYYWLKPHLDIDECNPEIFVEKRRIQKTQPKDFLSSSHEIVMAHMLHVSATIGMVETNYISKKSHKIINSFNAKIKSKKAHTASQMHKEKFKEWLSECKESGRHYATNKQACKECRLYFISNYEPLLKESGDAVFQLEWFSRNISKICKDLDFNILQTE